MIIFLHQILWGSFLGIGDRVSGGGSGGGGNGGGGENTGAWDEEDQNFEFCWHISKGDILSCFNP